MPKDIIDDGIVRFESNFAVENSGTVSFNSDDVRNFMRSSPGKIGDLALIFAVECCGQLGDDEEERNLCLSHALSQLEKHLKRMRQ